MPGASDSGEALVALARDRLVTELRELEALDPATLRTRLLQIEPQPSASRGALVHYIRLAVDDRREQDAHTLFLTLQRRIEGLTRQWERRTVLSSGVTLDPEAWRDCAKELTQELALLLWDKIACGDEEAWELFFKRSLGFAQGHIAEDWMRRVRPKVNGAPVAPPLLLSRLVDDPEDDVRFTPVSLPPAPDSISLAEFTDLRQCIDRLPERQRAAVILKMWYQASELEIAAALGGVTTRAVRYTLERAYDRLRACYGADPPDGGEEPAHGK